MDVIEIEGEFGLETIELGYISIGGDPTGGSHVHVQSMPAIMWTITHALAFLPSVTVLDADSNELDAAVSWPNATTVIVTLAASTAGKALLS